MIIGYMSYFLGVEQVNQRKERQILKEKYANQNLDKFKMNNCKPVRTPREVSMKLRHDSQSKAVNPTLYKSLIPYII